MAVNYFFFLGPFSKAGYILLLSQRTGMLHKSRQTNLLQDIFTFSFLLTFSRSLFAVKDNVTFLLFLYHKFPAMRYNVKTSYKVSLSLLEMLEGR